MIEKGLSGETADKIEKFVMLAGKPLGKKKPPRK